MSEVQYVSFGLITEVENRDVVQESPVHTTLIKDQDRLMRKVLRVTDVIVILIKTPGVQLICHEGNKGTAIQKGSPTQRISGRLDSSQVQLHRCICDITDECVFLCSHSFLILLSSC